MRTNEIFKSKKITLLIAVAITNVLFCSVVSAQCPCAVHVPNEKRLPAGFYKKDSPEYAELIKHYGIPPVPPKLRSTSDNGSTAVLTYALLIDVYRHIADYPSQGWGLFFNTAENPYQIITQITTDKPVNVMYSLYTFKTTNSQGGLRPGPSSDDILLQGIQECKVTGIFTTQNDIDTKLDKIKELGTYLEDGSGERIIDWDTKTGSDAVINGKNVGGMPVRDCVYVVAHETKLDANTGKYVEGNLLGMKVGNYAVERYKTEAAPLVEYTPIQGAVSAKITVAYGRPVRRIWAMLASSNCTVSWASFKDINSGAEAIAKTANSHSPGTILAVKELTNVTPTIAVVNDVQGNPQEVKTFKWDITTGLNGKPVVPPNDNTKYQMLLVLEGDDGDGNPIPTVTGVNDGYIYMAPPPVLFPKPLPGEYTGIQSPAADDAKIVIETTPDGFIINRKGNYDGEWALTSAAGAKVSSGKGSFVSKSGLPKGVYLLTVSNAQGGKAMQKVIVR